MGGQWAPLQAAGAVVPLFAAVGCDYPTLRGCVDPSGDGRPLRWPNLVPTQDSTRSARWNPAPRGRPPTPPTWAKVRHEYEKVPTRNSQ